jgi:hypothetical protein
VTQLVEAFSHGSNTSISDDGECIKQYKLWIVWSLRILADALDCNGSNNVKNSQAVIRTMSLLGVRAGVIRLLSFVCPTKLTMYQSQSVHSDLSGWIDMDSNEDQIFTSGSHNIHESKWANVNVNAENITATPRSLELLETTDSDVGSVARAQRRHISSKYSANNDAESYCDSENETEDGTSTDAGSTTEKRQPSISGKHALGGGHTAGSGKFSLKVVPLESILPVNGDDSFTMETFMYFVVQFLALLIKHSKTDGDFLVGKAGASILSRCLWLSSPAGASMHPFYQSGDCGSHRVLESIVSIIQYLFIWSDPCQILDSFLGSEIFSNMLVVVSVQPRTGRGMMSPSIANLLRDVICLSALVTVAKRIKSPVSRNIGPEDYEFAKRFVRSQFKSTTKLPMKAAAAYSSLFLSCGIARLRLPFQMQSLCLSLPPEAFSSLFNATICTPEAIWNSLLRQQCLVSILTGEAHKNWLSLQCDEENSSCKSNLNLLHPVQSVATYFSLVNPSDGPQGMVADYPFGSLNQSTCVEEHQELPFLAQEAEVQGIYLFMFMNSFPQEYFSSVNVQKLVTSLSFLFRIIGNSLKDSLTVKDFAFEAVSKDNLLGSLVDMSLQNKPSNEKDQDTLLHTFEYAVLYHDWRSLAWLPKYTQLSLVAMSIGRALQAWSTSQEYWNTGLAPILLQFLEASMAACDRTLAVAYLEPDLEAGHSFSDISELSAAKERESHKSNDELKSFSTDSNRVPALSCVDPYTGSPLPALQCSSTGPEKTAALWRSVAAVITVLMKSVASPFISEATRDDGQAALMAFNKTWCLMDVTLDNMCRLTHASCSQLHIVDLNSNPTTGAAAASLLTVCVTSLSTLSVHTVDFIHNMVKAETGVDKSLLTRIHRRWADSSLLSAFCVCVSKTVASVCPKVALAAIASLQLLLGHYNFLTENTTVLNISRGDSRGLNIEFILSALFGFGLGHRLLDTIIALQRQRSSEGSLPGYGDPTDSENRWAIHELTSSTAFYSSSATEVNAKITVKRDMHARGLATVLSETIGSEELSIKQWLKLQRERFQRPTATKRSSAQKVSMSSAVEGADLTTTKNPKGDKDWDEISQASRSTDGTFVVSRQILRSQSDLESVNSSLLNIDTPGKGGSASPFISVNRPSNVDFLGLDEVSASKAASHDLLIRECGELLRSLVLYGLQNENAFSPSQKTLPQNVNNVQSSNFNAYFGPLLESLLSAPFVYVLATDVNTFLRSLSSNVDIERPLFIWTVHMQSKLQAFLLEALTGVSTESASMSSAAFSLPGTPRPLHPQVSAECVVDNIYVRLLVNDNLKDDFGCRDLARFVERLQSNIASSKSLLSHVTGQGGSVGSPLKTNIDSSSIKSQLELKEKVLTKLLSDHPELGYSSLHLGEVDEAFEL